MNIETLAAHSGHEVDSVSGAVIPPLVLSTTFARRQDSSLIGQHLYSRMGNPNRDALEQTLAQLEGGGACVTFSSGQAASMSLFHALSPGDHILMPLEMYYNTRGLLENHYSRWNLQSSYVDMTDLKLVRQSVHEVGALCAVDNTWATPIFQNPLGLGADLVIHSLTKYIGGHSDILAGCIIGRDAEHPVLKRIRNFQATAGAVPSPFECWLLQRSIPSLPCRVRTQCKTAKIIAQFLNQHSRIETTHYPGLPGHPGYSIAASQMSDFGAMLSFEVKGGREAAVKTCSRLKLFTRATSLGGFESLIEHRVLVEGPTSTTPAGLLRCSIGLEHPDDLMADLTQALE
jgi:cystathionine gamma-synthase